MSFKQFHNSIRSITLNRHVNPVYGIAKHLQWQLKKALNLFPSELKFSQSRIIASHKRCGVAALINSQGLYNYNNMNLLKCVLKEGGVFFDVGANIGSYSLIASEQEKAQVYAFEPHPVTCDFLQGNIQLNNRKNVRIFNIALGSEEGEIFLTNNPGCATNYRVKQDENAIPVRCRRVDSVCHENQVVPNIVKIDVEGFEEDVLAGFGDIFGKVDLFIIELNGLSNIRSTGEESIYELFMKHNFLGPFYFDFDSQFFSRERSTNQEDSIFMSRSYCGKTTWRVSGRP